MNEQKVKELQAKFAPKECESQIEFERLMAELQDANTQAAHPYLDKIQEINHASLKKDKELHQLHAEIDSLKIIKLEVEQELKDVNRVFHDLKHQLVMLNPREKFVKPENAKDV